MKAFPTRVEIRLFGLFMFVTSCRTPLSLFCDCCHRRGELEGACCGA